MVSLKYKLCAKDIEETLLCIAWRKEGWLKKINILILSLLMIVFLYLSNKYPNQPYFFIIEFLTCSLLFFIIYGSKLKRKLTVKKILKKDNFYQLTIDEDGVFSNDNKQKLFFKNTNPEVFISDKVISLKLDKKIYCIPHNELSESENNKIMHIFEKNCIVRFIQTERSCNTKYEKYKKS